MTALRHYLECSFAHHRFLIPNDSDLLVESRENMQIEKKGRAAATRRVQGALWRAYALDGEFKPVLESGWTRAVFLETHDSRPVGLLVDDLNVLPVDTLRIEPFTALGPAPVPGHHLFQAAAMSPRGLTLVLTPSVLALYLRLQEGDYGLGE